MQPWSASHWEVPCAAESFFALQGPKSAREGRSDIEPVKRPVGLSAVPRTTSLTLLDREVADQTLRSF